MSSLGQGFINLNFEAANVPDVPANQVGTDVSMSAGMPGWTGSPLIVGTDILHNNVSAGGAVIGIEGPSYSSLDIFQGNYTAYVTGDQLSGNTSAYIAQTGQIPLGSMSIQFFVDQGGFANFQVTFGGNFIPTAQIGSAPIITSWAAMFRLMLEKLASCALRLSRKPGRYLDNIFFSSSPFPNRGRGLCWPPARFFSACAAGAILCHEMPRLNLRYCAPDRRRAEGGLLKGFSILILGRPNLPHKELVRRSSQPRMAYPDVRRR